MKKIIVSIVLFAVVLMGAAQSCDTIVVTDDTCYLEDFTAFPECWDLIPSSNPWVYNGVYLSSD